MKTRKNSKLMTPDELKNARQSLGLSAEGFAKWVEATDGSQVRKWERGATAIPGPVRVLVKAALESRSVRRHFGLSLLDDSTSKSE